MTIKVIFTLFVLLRLINGQSSQRNPLWFLYKICLYLSGQEEKSLLNMNYNTEGKCWTKYVILLPLLQTYISSDYDSPVFMNQNPSQLNYSRCINFIISKLTFISKNLFLNVKKYANYCMESKQLKMETLQVQNQYNIKRPWVLK